MCISEMVHSAFFSGSFVLFFIKKPPAFGAAPSFWFILLSFLGLSFRHIPNNVSYDNVLTANAPFYKISGTWSTHEGSILSWCRIPCFFGCLLCYRGPQTHLVQRSCRRNTLGSSLEKWSNFAQSMKSFRHDSGKSNTLPFPFYRESGPKVFREGLTGQPFRFSTERQRVFCCCSRDPLSLGKVFLGYEKASYFDEKRVGIALFFFPFLSASSDPFVRNLLVRTEPLSESNPVPKDPLSAIHPPCIYAGDVASAMGYCFSRSNLKRKHKVELLPIRKDADKKGTLLRSACVGSSITCFHFYQSKLLLKEYQALFFLNKRALLSRLFKRIAFRKREPGRKDTSSLTEANTVVSYQSPIRIWILTCRWFLTVGILPGSWWAHHELGRGGWWFRDPVENASFIPRVLATALFHSVILTLHSWTSLLNIVTLPCCLLGTFSIRSGLLAPVHSFTIDTRGSVFFWFFLLLTGISSMLLYRKMLASVRCTFLKEMVKARSTLFHH